MSQFVLGKFILTWHASDTPNPIAGRNDEVVTRHPYWSSSLDLWRSSETVRHCLWTCGSHVFRYHNTPSSEDNGELISQQAAGSWLGSSSRSSVFIAGLTSPSGPPPPTYRPEKECRTTWSHWSDAKVVSVYVSTTAFATHSQFHISEAFRVLLPYGANAQYHRLWNPLHY